MLCGTYNLSTSVGQKAVTNNTSMNKDFCVPIKLYLQKQEADWTWLTGLSSLTLSTDASKGLFTDADTRAPFFMPCKISATDIFPHPSTPLLRGSRVVFHHRPGQNLLIC